MKTQVISLKGFILAVVWSIIFFGCGSDSKTVEPTPIEKQYAGSFTKDSLIQYLQKELSLVKDTTSYFPDSIKYFEILKLYYSEKGFQPVSISEKLHNPDVDSLLFYLKNSEIHGLRPDYYRFDELKEMLDSVENEFTQKKTINYKFLARSEILLSNSLLEYSGDLQYGRIHPAELWPQYHNMKTKVRDSTMFFEPLKTLSKSIYLKSIQPEYKAYKDLQKALKYYYMLKEKGGWDSLYLSVEKIEFGDKTDFTDSLAKRLLQTFDIDSVILTKMPFTAYNDSILFEAVKKYQVKNGLLDDGIIGKNTVNSLNVSVDDRITQIAANLERFRWFEYPDTGVYVKVNLPEFMFYLYEKDQAQLTMRICCGEKKDRNYDEKMKTYYKTKKKYHKPNNHETPTMYSKITYFVLNPDWTVPKNITDNEIVYKAMKDSFYIENNNYVIYDGHEIVDPDSIDWKYYASRKLPYKIKQSPGAGNALGKIKFMFDNKFSIYLHDTPNKAAFHRAYRAVSHGCVRIQKPLDFAEFLVEDHKRWDFDDVRIELGMKPIDDENKKIFKRKMEKYKEKMEKLEEEDGELETRKVFLEKGIPLYIDYYTTWVDSANIIQFRQDMYDRDKDLVKKLFSSTPIKP